MLDTRHTTGRLKPLLARALISSPSAAALSLIHRGRMTNHGVAFDTRGDVNFTRKIEAQLYLGLYEKAEIKMLREYAAGQSAILELGSSIGVTTAHILDVMDPDGRLVCVEANPAVIPSLRRTIETHRKNQQVDVLPVAVSNTPVFMDIRSSLGTRLANTETATEVDSAPLSEVLERANIAGDYTLICDIEGAESHFIYDDTKALDNCRLLLIELDDTTYKGRDLLADDIYDELVNLGFKSKTQHAAVVAMTR